MELVWGPPMAAALVFIVVGATPTEKPSAVTTTLALEAAVLAAVRLKSPSLAPTTAEVVPVSAAESAPVIVNAPLGQN